VSAALDLQPLSRLFKALGDETRLRIVALLSYGELCVCHVEEGLGLPQPTASRQLGILKNAGIVESRREGTWVHYRLARQLDEGQRRQVAALVKDFAKHDVLRRDAERLLKARKPCR
jgi:ArsR family transcriptional regulator